MSSVFSSTHCCIVIGAGAPEVVIDNDHSPDLRRCTSSAANADALASAQVKSAVMLAGLLADGETIDLYSNI